MRRKEGRGTEEVEGVEEGGREREFQGTTCRDGRWSDEEEETGVMGELEE